VAILAHAGSMGAGHGPYHYRGKISLVVNKNCKFSLFGAKNVDFPLRAEGKKFAKFSLSGQKMLLFHLENDKKMHIWQKSAIF
jgi:hypothetical protein